MKETRIFEYYAFGYNYSQLRTYASGEAVHGDELDCLVPRLERFLEFLEGLQLRVTNQASETVRVLLADAKAMPKDATVDKKLAGRVRDVLEAVDATLDAELQLTNAFAITPKRFATDQLLRTPLSLLANGVFRNLPDLCQFDFAEGCCCVAFERPTAAAFHFMRCVEGALRKYYCGIVRRGRVKRMMWYDMVDHLSKRRDAPPRPLLDNLNNIRANFRNPTQHPEAKYDIDEAQDLLAVTIDVLNRMARDQLARLLA